MEGFAPRLESREPSSPGHAFSHSPPDRHTFSLCAEEGKALAEAQWKATWDLGPKCRPPASQRKAKPAVHDITGPDGEIVCEPRLFPHWLCDLGQVNGPL